MSEEFSGGPLYHGTKYQLQPGQEITADGARQADPGYPAHIRHVWATTLPLNAATHATKHGREYWDTGRVYEVEPINRHDVERDPLQQPEQTADWRSASGFRVLAEIGSPEDLWFGGWRPESDPGQTAMPSAGMEAGL